MKSRVLLTAAVGIAAASLAMWLFPRAMPIIGLRQDLSREQVLARADSFFRVHGVAPAHARTAVHFVGDDSLRIFVELGAGGHDSLNALVRGRDVAAFAWTVRAFIPGDPREAHVDLAPDGRIIGFDRTLAEADVRPNLAPDSARRIAEQQLHRWIDSGADSAQWRLVSTSAETRKVSGRVDHSFTFERTDRRVGGAPIRADVSVAGDLPAGAGTYVEIPESFARRYAEMRSWNGILAAVASLGILFVAIAGAVALTRYARGRGVRWREPMVVAGVIGVLTLAAGLNELPGSWFWYDTAMSATTHFMTQLMAAVGLAVVTALMAAFTLAAAEVATRHAFPHHLDWWKLWRYRGTKEVAQQVGGGYVVATIAFAYVALFYLVTRTLFGWWVPSEVLDDPNLIATPLPWMAGIAISLNAGVWEEALFRALPLSLLSLYIGQRAHRRWWMVGGAMATALVFGFAHSDYASWPPYSRGIEIFLDALFWAFLFVRFGLLMTVVAHFVYDAVLFGIFAASGSAPAYRVSAAIILVAILAPALAVLWRRWRQGHFTDAPDDARFAAWVPAAEAPAVVVSAPAPTAAFSARSRQLALAAAVVAAIVAVARPASPVLGPDFTVSRERVLQVSDSMLRAQGTEPSGWRRLTAIGNDTLPEWGRFQRQHRITNRADDLARTYHPATWWVVRYVHTTGTAAARIEEWRMRVWPDGRPLDARHIIPDSVARDTADAVALRRTARAVLARVGVDTLVLRETDVTETARPARRDVLITYTDTSLKLPAGAEARAWVQIAGDEPLVGRRGIQLPEDFLRRDTEVQSTRQLVFGVTMMALLTLVIVGAVVVKRRRAPLVDDGYIDRGRMFLAAGALLLLLTLSALNGLPSQLASYDTSQPWSTFMGMTAFGFVSALVFALMVVGLWMVLDAMRRRVGVPILPEAAPQARAREVLLAGAGLGAVVYVASNLGALVAPRELAQAPRTSLDQAIPLLDGLADIPADALLSVAVAGIPLLVIAALTRRWALRVAIGAAFLIALAVAGWATREPDEIFNASRLAAGVVGAGLALSALIAWGPRSVVAWLVAALTNHGLQSLRDAVHQTTGQEQVAGMLNLLMCVLLVWLIVRAVSRHGAAAGTSTTAVTAIASDTV